MFSWYRKALLKPMEVAQPYMTWLLAVDVTEEETLQYRRS